MQTLNWDDLRFFLAVARSGGLLSAARVLGVDHTTVARRLTALESAIGAQLVERSPRGARLTDAGTGLLEHAERIEAEAMAASARFGSAEQRPSGTVRLATPEAFGAWLVAPAASTFHNAHPGIQLDLVPASRVVNLSKREADLAVTLARPTQGRLAARKLADYRLGLYASRAYLEAAGPIENPSDLGRHPLVWYIDDLLDVPELRYIDQVAAGARPVFRSSSIVAQQAAVASGLGLGVLHVFAASQDPRLVRVLPEAVEIKRSYWLVLHADQRNLPRIRAVAEFLEQFLIARRSDL